MDPAEALITKVLTKYYPGWEPPPNRAKWNKCRCPVHDEDNPSASVSYEFNAFKCHGCGAKGNAVAIIMREEEIAYGEAVKHAESLHGGSGKPVPRKPDRKPGRRVFGDPGPTGTERIGGGRPVPPWLRG